MATKKQNKLKSYRDKMLESRQQSLDFFANNDFRYDQIGFINGCATINDSGAISLTDTLISLEITKTPVHLILGSVEVPRLLQYLEKVIKLKVVTIGVFGENDFTRKFEISQLVDKTYYSPKMDDVVLTMINWLKEGETLLFSPANLEIKSNEDYAKRGMHFNKLVQPYLN